MRSKLPADCLIDKEHMRCMNEYMNILTRGASSSSAPLWKIPPASPCHSPSESSLNPHRRRPSHMSLLVAISCSHRHHRHRHHHHRYGMGVRKRWKCISEESPILSSLFKSPHSPSHPSGVFWSSGCLGVRAED